MYTPVDEAWALGQLNSGNWEVHRSTRVPLFKGTGRLDGDCSKAYRFCSVPGMRRSKTTSSNGVEYDLLLNGLRRWQPYPLRNASLVCSTSRSTASKYGPIWRVILPTAGRVTIAPRNDIWYSFERPLVALGLGGADPSLLRLNEAITSARLYLGLPAACDYPDLIRLLEEIASTPPASIRTLASTTLAFVYRLQEHVGHLESWFDELLDPGPNGFVTSSTAKFVPAVDLHDREVWTDSDCLLIEETTFVAWQRRAIAFK